MQGEYHPNNTAGSTTGTTGAAMAAYSGDLTVVSVSTATTPITSNFGDPHLLSGNSSYSHSTTTCLTPYNSVMTPAMTTATEIISSSQASRASMTSQHQDFINRHALCLSHLHSAAKEVATLRQENSDLRSINHHLSLLVQSYTNSPSIPQGGGEGNFGDAVAAAATFDLVNRCRGLSMSENEVDQEGNNNESPTSVMEGSDVDRMALPKSISVRSTEYLKAVTCQGQGEGNPAAAIVKSRSRAGSSSAGKQKVYVRGGKKEEAPLELEVYNQGMFKTELCNKWQESGSCPYGDHCQFAHGIQELRPVIRHPRYKTEVCRMVLAGDVCPYGHRCHFRHALTDQERFMGMTPLQTRDTD